MQLKVIISKALRTMFGDLRRAIVGLIVGAIVLAYGGIYLFAKKLFDASIVILTAPLPIWAAIAFGLLLAVYMRLRGRRPNLPTDISFYQALGVFWDDRLNMHCLSCGTLLKNSSHGPSVFYCADPRCNSKHILKNDTGNELTKQEAVNLVKSANRQIEPTPQSAGDLKITV
jgi:hypothetical protein